MTHDQQHTRRGFLVAGAASAVGAAGVAAGLMVGGGAVLSGCGTSDCENWSDKYQPSTPSPSAVGDKPVLAVLADIPVGQSVTARTPAGDPIIISRPDNASAVAFSARCTHNNCLVNPDGDRLHCPPHDGYFNTVTGKPQGGPPEKSLRRVAVTVVDGKVVMAG